MTRSSTKELFTPLDNPERVFRSKRRLFETLGLVETNSPEFDLFSDIEEHSEEEAIEVMTETMEQYMIKTRRDYGSGVTRTKIDGNAHFKLKGKFLKNFAIILSAVRNINMQTNILKKFWRLNELAGLILTWEVLKSKFLRKYYSPARTAKKIDEINNFKQEHNESLFRAWERFKELLMKCPQHYLTDMQEVILFYNELDVPTRQILDSKGVIPTKTTTNAKVSIQKMAEYS
ncbi:retrovirus-related pol polyprotein from transposon TNT 1-94 [Tanacetum coccineum]